MRIIFAPLAASLLTWLLFASHPVAVIPPDLSRRAVPTSDGATSDDLLEVGGVCADPVSRAACERAASVSPTTLKVVSYNIRWRSGDDLSEIIEHMKGDGVIGGAHLVGLQEVDRDRERSARTNTARTIADRLGMNYAWAAPPLPDEKKSDDGKKKPKAKDDEEETGVAVLSPYKLTDVTRIVLPHPGPGGRRRAAIGATAHVGKTPVRLYSVHAETRVSVEERIDQLEVVLEDLARFPAAMPAIVLGDFNTWQPDSKRDTIRLFTAANFATPFPPGQPTFRHKLVRLRLDWIWLRGFDTPSAHGIARDIKVSDHYPLWLDAKLPGMIGVGANSKPTR